MTAPKKTAKRSAVKTSPIFANPRSHNDGKPEPESFRTLADRSVLRLLRKRGAELARCHQARGLRTHDHGAEIAADVYAEALDAIALELAAHRAELRGRHPRHR